MAETDKIAELKRMPKFIKDCRRSPTSRGEQSAIVSGGISGGLEILGAGPMREDIEKIGGPAGLEPATRPV
jgi:hypothetical protein